MNLSSLSKLNSKKDPYPSSRMAKNNTWSGLAWDSLTESCFLLSSYPSRKYIESNQVHKPNPRDHDLRISLFDMALKKHSPKIPSTDLDGFDTPRSNSKMVFIDKTSLFPDGDF